MRSKSEKVHLPRDKIVTMTKSVAIIQSNYIPWKGYFDIINSVDEFVLFDDVQYTRRDWRNRNKIKTANGAQWITVPVEVKGKFSQKIRETRVSDGRWAQEHWRSILHSYAKANCFDQYHQQIKTLYERASELEFLSEVNFLLIEAVCNLLGIETRLSWSSDYELKDEKTERLLSICEQLNATEYVSGLAAREYLDVGAFEAKNIKVTWYEYSGYPEYEQLHGEFDHAVTVLDLLLNTGTRAPEYMRSFGKRVVTSQ